MLVHGCATGPVPLNLTALLPALTLLLNTAMDLAAGDPVAHIQGDAGLSPADVCLVLTAMKV